LLREYELMCVVGRERDLIRLRTNYRRDPRLSLSDQDHAGADAEDVRGHGVQDHHSLECRALNAAPAADSSRSGPAMVERRRGFRRCAAPHAGDLARVVRAKHLREQQFDP
jgi:hypothetical protein